MKKEIKVGDCFKEGNVPKTDGNTERASGGEINMDNYVRCQQCGKNSTVKSSGNIGADAARVEDLGWKVKLPILVGIAEWSIACSEECLKTLLSDAYKKHSITQKDKDDAKILTDDFKARIPEMAAETSEKLGELQTLFNALRKENK